MTKRFRKVTVGYVVQEFEAREDGVSLKHQYFVAGEVSYEDCEGKALEEGDYRETGTPIVLATPEYEKWYITTDGNGKVQTRHGDQRSMFAAMEALGGVDWVPHDGWIFGGYWKDCRGRVWFPDIEFRVED